MQDRTRPALPKRRKWIRLLVGLILTLVTVLLLGAFYQAESSRHDLQTFPPLGKMVDVGGYRLHIYCTGQRVGNSPTVLFEGGLGAASVVWIRVQQGVTAHTRACSYDRAGYGWSDPARSQERPIRSSPSFTPCWNVRVNNRRICWLGIPLAESSSGCTPVCIPLIS